MEFVNVLLNCKISRHSNWSEPAIRKSLNEKADELLIEYNAGMLGSMCIGAESFFFQEGKATKYEKAKYGGIKVDRQGNSVLIGLYNENRKEIK